MRDEKRTMEFVFEKGRRYTPNWLPPDIDYGEVGDCFDHCLLGAVQNPKYKYVEGIARNVNDGQWVFHAWLTTGEDALDPTWRAERNGKNYPLYTEYIGFEIKVGDMVDFLRATQYKSILCNGWRKPELARKILPEIFNEKM